MWRRPNMFGKQMFPVPCGLQKGLWSSSPAKLPLAHLAHTLWLSLVIVFFLSQTLYQNSLGSLGKKLFWSLLFFKNNQPKITLMLKRHI